MQSSQSPHEYETQRYLLKTESAPSKLRLVRYVNVDCDSTIPVQKIGFG